jgi:hypothetical protein
LILFAVASLAASGCATITSSETQVVSLSTKTADGQVVEKVKCTLRNDKGIWETQSPGFASVRRSAEDLMVECKKEGLPDGLLRAISRAAGGMWGNIIFGGGIGAIIDHNKGTGYDYPNDLPVKMGASTTIDKKEEVDAQQRAAAYRGSATPAQQGGGAVPTADNSMGYPPNMGGFQSFGGRPSQQATP